jgi:hypothetical protein
MRYSAIVRPVLARVYIRGQQGVDDRSQGDRACEREGMALNRCGDNCLGQELLSCGINLQE